MGKTKEIKAKASKSNPLSVKNAGVTKPAQTVEAKSKKMAKDIASKAVNGKKRKVEESESESESSESESDSEASSSDEESEDEAPKKAPVTNGKAKAAAAKDESSDSSDSSEDDSEDDSESESEAAVVKTNGAAKAEAESDSSDSSDSSDNDSEDDSEDEAETKPAAAKAVNGKAKADASVSFHFLTRHRPIYVLTMPCSSLTKRKILRALTIPRRTQTTQMSLILRRPRRSRSRPRSVRLRRRLLHPSRRLALRTLTRAPLCSSVTLAGRSMTTFSTRSSRVVAALSGPALSQTVSLAVLEALATSTSTLPRTLRRPTLRSRVLSSRAVT